MKRIMFFTMLAMLLVYVGCGQSFASAAKPLGNGLFSVAKGKQVRFAPGNLEYDGTKGYRFADCQYEYGGYFGWGTGSKPMLTAMDRDGYPTFDDWGSHIDSGWRTLTSAEWKYVIEKRPNASAKRGAATVCGVQGIVLLPDNFRGGTFIAGFEKGWSTNEYDETSWPAMESAGAVFLPAAGYRYGTKVNNVGAYGDYWSSTPSCEYDAYYVYFGEDCLTYDGINIRYYGSSVRLVRDC